MPVIELSQTQIRMLLESSATARGAKLAADAAVEKSNATFVDYQRTIDLVRETVGIPVAIDQIQVDLKLGIISWREAPDVQAVLARVNGSPVLDEET